MTPSELDDPGRFAPVVAAAGQVLTRTWNQQIRLDDVALLTEEGRRNVVLRCTLSGGPASSVIIKQAVTDHYNPDDETSTDVRRFFSDWAGAAFLSARPDTSELGPRFYGGDRALGFFVLEDLGPHRSLVEPLMEGDAASASLALRAFAATLGKLHAATIGHASEFERLCRTLHPAGVASGHTVSTFPAAGTRLLDAFERLGVPVEPGFPQELETVTRTLTGTGPFFAYLHGDPCPDNVVFRVEHVRLIDFEFGRFGHALLDGTYGRMMFPTCWCANRLPASLVTQMESVYRAELATACPEAEDDRIFEHAVTCVCAFWAFNTVDRLLAMALEGDPPWGIATVRPRVVARLETFVATAEAFHGLPAVRGTASRLLEVLRRRWPETSTLPLYPAFAV